MCGGNSDNLPGLDIVQVGVTQTTQTLSNLDNVQLGHCLSQGNLDNSDLVQLRQFRHCLTWTFSELEQLRQLRYCLTWQVNVTWTTLTLSNLNSVFVRVTQTLSKLGQLRTLRQYPTWTTRTVTDVVWKSWLFPHMQYSFWARRWVPMKLLQWTCTKLKLHTRLAPCATYKKPQPWWPCICLELLSLRQVWINICKRMLESYFTVAVWPSWDCSRPRCCK